MTSSPRPGDLLYAALAGGAGAGLQHERPFGLGIDGGAVEVHGVVAAGEPVGSLVGVVGAAGMAGVAGGVGAQRPTGIGQVRQEAEVRPGRYFVPLAGAKAVLVQHTGGAGAG